MSPSVREPVVNVSGGHDAAMFELTPALYLSLRRIASSYLSAERPNHTLQATALVHEAYLKLNGIRERQFKDETHLLAVASRIMRQVLVDYARSRMTQKRLGQGSREPLCATTVETVALDRGPGFREVMELDGALSALAAENQLVARLIEMRYFGGLTAEQSAEALGMSVHVVRHHLRFAQAWLRKRLSS